LPARSIAQSAVPPVSPARPRGEKPLTPGEIYECDIEIASTCILVPAGRRMALSVRGKDYKYEGELSEFGKKFHYGMRGSVDDTH